MLFVSYYLSDLSDFSVCLDSTTSDVISEQGSRGQRRLLVTSEEEINVEELRFPTPISQL